MITALQHPIKSLPCALPNGSRSGKVQIEIVPMTRSLIIVWRQYVQIWIDLHYKHWQQGLLDEDVRADVGWNWLKIYRLAGLHNVASRAPGSKSGTALAWCLVISDASSGKQFPVGMLTVVPKFSCNVNNDIRQRTFAWYLSDAPTEVYDALKIERIRGVATALIDTAIQSGLDLKGDGTLLLHADPEGGTKLVKFYGQKCGMMQLPNPHPPISTWRKNNPHEYFVLDAVKARLFCAKYDGSR